MDMQMIKSELENYRADLIGQKDTLLNFLGDVAEAENTTLYNNIIKHIELLEELILTFDEHECHRCQVMTPNNVLCDDCDSVMNG
jgi:hypothetical protein